MVVGLTGGIGSGKSTVLNYFKKLGVKIFIADIEAKKVMNSNRLLKEKIISLLGNQAYINNKLNRAYVASVVFNNSEKLTALNNLVHPIVRLEFEKFKNNHRGKIIIYEAAILFESGNDKNCDYIITVTAQLEERIKRLIKRDNTTRSQIESRMLNQIDDNSRIYKSHFVINNSNLQQVKVQVSTIFSMLKSLNKKYNIS